MELMNRVVDQVFGAEVAMESGSDNVILEGVVDLVGGIGATKRVGTLGVDVVARRLETKSHSAAADTAVGAGHSFDRVNVGDRAVSNAGV